MFVVIDNIAQKLCYISKFAFENRDRFYSVAKSVINKFGSTDVTIHDTSWVSRSYHINTFMGWHRDGFGYSRDKYILIVSYPNPTQILINSDDYPNIDASHVHSDEKLKGEIFTPNFGDVVVMSQDMIHRVNPLSNGPRFFLRASIDKINNLYSPYKELVYNATMDQ